MIEGAVWKLRVTVWPGDGGLNDLTSLLFDSASGCWAKLLEIANDLAPGAYAFLELSCTKL